MRRLIVRSAVAAACLLLPVCAVAEQPSDRGQGNADRKEPQQGKGPAAPVGDSLRRPPRNRPSLVSRRPLRHRPSHVRHVRRSRPRLGQTGPRPRTAWIVAGRRRRNPVRFQTRRTSRVRQMSQAGLRRVQSPAALHRFTGPGATKPAHRLNVPWRKAAPAIWGRKVFGRAERLR